MYAKKALDFTSKSYLERNFLPLFLYQKHPISHKLYDETQFQLIFYTIKRTNFIFKFSGKHGFLHNFSLTFAQISIGFHIKVPRWNTFQFDNSISQFILILHKLNSTSTWKFTLNQFLAIVFAPQKTSNFTSSNMPIYSSFTISFSHKKLNSTWKFCRETWPLLSSLCKKKNPSDFTWKVYTETLFFCHFFLTQDEITCTCKFYNELGVSPCFFLL